MLVKAIAVDDQDRVKLSRKAALAERGQPDELASRTRPRHPAVAATRVARRRSAAGRPDGVTEIAIGEAMAVIATAAVPPATLIGSNRSDRIDRSDPIDRIDRASAPARVLGS